MKKLWKLFIERKLLKKVLIVMSGISQSAVTMLKHNNNINTEVII